MSDESLALTQEEREWLDARLDEPARELPKLRALMQSVDERRAQ